LGVTDAARARGPSLCGDQASAGAATRTVRPLYLLALRRGRAKQTHGSRGCRIRRHEHWRLPLPRAGWFELFAAGREATGDPVGRDGARRITQRSAHGSVGERWPRRGLSVVPSATPDR